MISVLSKINRILLIAAGICLIAMVALTSANIVLRLFWVPIRGTYELMGFFGALATAFALGYTQLQKGHIAVDILINSFPRRTKRILEAINGIAIMVFFSVMAWQISRKAWVLQTTGEVTETLRIVYYPFTYGVALGCGFLALVFLGDLIRVFATQQEKKP